MPAGLFWLEAGHVARCWRDRTWRAGTIRGAVSSGLSASAGRVELHALPVGAGVGAATQERRADGRSAARDQAGAAPAVPGGLAVGCRGVGAAPAGLDGRRGYGAPLAAD